MPNHFHILLKEIDNGDITKFMRKLGTAYTMYFNTKNERVGNLFVKPFRSKHVGDDLYFKQVAKYIHLNPAELFESGWKNGRVKNLPLLKKKLESYLYSSFPDYCEMDRPETAVLDKESVDLLRDITVSKDLIAEAAAYYGSLPR